MAQESSTQTKHSQSSGATSMADLMARHTTPFQTFHKGDTVKGKITKLSKHESLVDINAKSEALIIEKDRRVHNLMLSKLQVGDEVEATVINPESEAGIPLVSLRRFLENMSWSELEALQKDQEQIIVTITDTSKGGYVVVTEKGLSGFLPHSHTSMVQDQELTVGKTIKVSVLELNRSENKIIFSQKGTVSDKEFADAIKSLKIGQKITVPVVNTTSFGLFVSVQLPTDESAKTLSLDGLIHISEISWDKVEDINELFSIGQKVEAVIIGFDKNAKRVDLSIKQLTANPFDKLMEQFSLDKKVVGKVVRVDEKGVYVDLGDSVEGLIKKDTIPPTVSYKVDQSVNVTVSEHDKRRHRIILSPVLLEKPIGYR